MVIKALVICLFVILLAFAGGKHEDELEQTFHIVVAAGFVFLQLRKKDWEEVENKLFFGLEPLLSPLREAGHRKDSFPRLS